jgi:hypothetical protein
MGGYKEKYKVISDWGLILKIIKKKYQTQKIDVIISFCEKQGISSLLQHNILKERIDFLMRNSLLTLIKANLFTVKKFLIRK